jgi:hypothetical protein
LRTLANLLFLFEQFGYSKTLRRFHAAAVTKHVHGEETLRQRLTTPATTAVQRRPRRATSTSSIARRPQ